MSDTGKSRLPLYAFVAFVALMGALPPRRT